MANEIGLEKIENPINQLLSLNSEKETARRAVNQLLLVVAGSEHANLTEELKNSPKSRLKRCTELAMDEYAFAQSLLQDCVPDAKRMISDAKRKLECLSSLSCLANVVELIQ